MSKNNGFGKFLLGAGIGAGLGILFAPKAGKDTRRELKVLIDDAISKLRDIDYEEVKEEFEIKLYEIRHKLEDLDKEKVLEIAKEKVEEIQNLTEELVDYAIEKGTPVLEKTADTIREKAKDVTKEVLAKLEQVEPKVNEVKEEVKKRVTKNKEK